MPGFVRWRSEPTLYLTPQIRSRLRAAVSMGRSGRVARACRLSLSALTGPDIPRRRSVDDRETTLTVSDEHMMPAEFPDSAEGRRTAIGDFLLSQPADRAFIPLGMSQFPDNSRQFGADTRVGVALTAAGVFDSPTHPRGSRPNELDARVMMIETLRPPQSGDPPGNVRLA